MSSTHEGKKFIEIHTSTSEVEEEKTKGATKNSWLLDHINQEKKDLGIFEAIPSPMVGTLKCDYCNKDFSTISNINKHMRIVHKVCPHCDVGFSTHKSLSEHRLAEKCPSKGQKKPREKRSDVGQKRGVKDGPERASGSGAKGLDFMT